MALGIRICDTIIEYSFYSLFFLIPLVFTDRTSELFEFNKMWLTFIISSIIAACWGVKMVLKKEFLFQKTLLDIPILFFLLSQMIATIFSLDQRVSVWGYYSRFNGGLLSIGTYIFLYYALVTNARDIIIQQTSQKIWPQTTRVLLYLLGFALFPLALFLAKPAIPVGESAHPVLVLLFLLVPFFLFTRSLSHSFVKKLLLIILTTGLIVTLWGIPSHFGYDPTCYLFRGSFDVACWTESFQPIVRIFSTLGQPAWLAAYMAILLPIAIAFFLKTQIAQKKNLLLISYFLLLITMFYASLIFTNTRAGFIAFWLVNGIFWAFVALKHYLSIRGIIASFLLVNLSFLFLNFFFGSPVAQLEKFTLKHFRTKQTIEKIAIQPTTQDGTGVTDSGDIRLIVWKGGIDAWKANPLIGTGVETFAFAYSQYRPKEHNLTSEWDYTYNKAHNEYINYLTTTGLFGFVSYLAIIFVFLICTIRKLLTSKATYEQMFICALVASYISILISNFFGFSVVIINIFFFLIPAFVFLLQKPISEKATAIAEKNEKTIGEQRLQYTLSNTQWLGISIILFTTFSMIFVLTRFWYADLAYTKGQNVNRLGKGEEAYALLTQALTLRGDEPVFQEELAMSNVLAAVTLKEEQKATEAAQLANNALLLSENVITRHPNNVSFWKNRVRMLYELARIDPQFLLVAIESLEKAQKIAPTDAKLLYNLGYVYRLTGSPEKTVEILEKTIQLKPDYKDAYFTLGLAYHDLAIDKNGVVVDPAKQKKAQDTLEYIVNSISAKDEETIKTLKSWNAL